MGTAVDDGVGEVVQTLGELQLQNKTNFSCGTRQTTAAEQDKLQLQNKSNCSCRTRQAAAAMPCTRWCYWAELDGKGMGVSRLEHESTILADRRGAAV